jgi:hypothetical protein
MAIASRFKIMLGGVALLIAAVAVAMVSMPALRTADREADIGVTAAPPGDRSICEASPATRGYVAPEVVQRLRATLASDRREGALAHVDQAGQAVLHEAARIGTDGAFFAARVLRSWAIVDALQAKVACGDDLSCRPAAIIAHLKSDAPSHPNRARSWDGLLADWNGFLAADIQRSRICLAS